MINRIESDSIVIEFNFDEIRNKNSLVDGKILLLQFHTKPISKLLHKKAMIEKPYKNRSR